MFTHNFLRRLIESLWSVERCLVTAYEETLGRHHGLVVKSVFSVAIRRSPNREEATGHVTNYEIRLVLYHTGWILSP